MLVDIGDVVFDEATGGEVEGVCVTIHLPVDDVGVPIENFFIPAVGPLLALVPPSFGHEVGGLGGEPFEAIRYDFGIVGVHGMYGDGGAVVSFVEFLFDGFGFLAEPVFFVAGEVLEVGFLIVARGD